MFRYPLVRPASTRLRSMPLLPICCERRLDGSVNSSNTSCGGADPLLSLPAFRAALAFAIDSRRALDDFEVLRTLPSVAFDFDAAEIREEVVEAGDEGDVILEAETAEGGRRGVLILSLDGVMSPASDAAKAVLRVALGFDGRTAILLLPP